jgi:hypothetical protein
MQEILTAEEFAQRLKIGRSSLFEWMRKGILIPGKHYFKLDRVLRFVWSETVITDLLQQTDTGSVAGGNLPPAKLPVCQPHGRRKGNSKPQINWDY